MQTVTSAECRTRIGDQVVFSRECTSQAPPESPCVVLVHGYVASSRYMVPAMRELAPHCRVYVPDLPGWGESTKPAHALELVELADVLAGWVDARDIERPVFLGNSFGCQIAAELAVRYPDVASGLILLGPTIDPLARTAIRQALRLAADVPRERPSLWLLELWDLFHMGARRAIEIAQIMLDDRIEDKLPQITVPTLVIRGSRDPIVPRRWADEVTRLLPNGRLAILPDTGHAANYSAPKRLTEAILPFIEGQSYRSSVPGI